MPTKLLLTLVTEYAYYSHNTILSCLNLLTLGDFFAWTDVQVGLTKWPTSVVGLPSQARTYPGTTQHLLYNSGICPRPDEYYWY